MGLCRTVSEIDGDFSQKLQNFLTRLYFAPPLKWFSLELGTGAGSQKNRMMGLPGRQRSLTISLAVWIECTNVTDRQTDGRTDTGPQQRPRLCIASRGNKINWNRNFNLIKPVIFDFKSLNFFVVLGPYVTCKIVFCLVTFCGWSKKR